MENFKRPLLKVVPAVLLATVTFLSGTARASECQTLDALRLEKIRVQNEGLVEKLLVDQTKARLEELENMTDDVLLGRILQAGGGAALLLATWGFSWDNAKNANRYYENGYHLIRDLLKKSPTFGFFTAVGTWGVTEGSARLVIHYRDIAVARSAMEERQKLLLQKSNLVKEKIFLLEQAMKKAGCQIPEEELKNPLEIKVEIAK